ncbi:T9SS type A sorting domain-containing protein [Spirosoma sp. KUDC1026]|uniref:T9SS type A sorting domain-containing protein n=1 Tax=Spirosoma sp. KUDC1026 TaxID=2745947 RepID=UPI00159B892D|nr:T9SS type A sorting domain-containing protein [Spirosoma sp. KUDC1026]QKZ11797.1 T9SS type A sorting domain-containing protein [Spirosoma sp. KUDC1026]
MTYWKLPAWLLVAGLLLSSPLLAQRTGQSEKAASYQQFVRQMRTEYPGVRTICYGTNRDAFTKLLPPDAFLKSRQNPNARQAAATSQFIVTYNGFSPQAQAAFQYAVDIWSTLIVSSVPIRIRANWTRQANNVLGSAGPTGYRILVNGSQKATSFYPIALAEKISRTQLNHPDSSDISANFNQNYNWYYGTDAKPPAGQADLVSVVLHEIGHGLGIIGGFGTTGSLGEFSAGQPFVYDNFIENSQGQRLVNSFQDNSNALYRQLTGGALYLNGPILRRNTGQRARIYAPVTFAASSSIYHLDETAYPAGNINSLMTPQIDNAEAIHNPGPLILNLFTDMEWKTTSVLHTPLADSEDSRDLVFRVQVVSDTVLNENSIRLFYRKGGADTTYTSVTPTRVGTTNEYTYTLPAAQAQGDVRYYFQAQDASGRTFTNPGKRPDGSQLPHQVQTGPDNTPPIIRYSPDKNFIFNPAATDSLSVYAHISDNRATGIDTAYVEYRVNGGTQVSGIPLFYNRATFIDGFDSVYVGRIRFAANSLKAGDQVSYRIVARDSSRARNQAATAFYTLSVVGLQAARSSYTNSFTAAGATTDFANYGFSVTTTAGITNPALQSEHPYRNGSNYAYQSNYESVLLVPITLKTNPDSAVIRFSEIVLVEPNESGSAFGNDGFYDYVIVEGSRDNGRNWREFQVGYNANDQVDWLNAFNRGLVADPTNASAQNSTAVGTTALYKQREIQLLGNGFFQGGNQVLIRFRLYADQLVHGWGWAIDNLQIQVPPPPPVLATEPISKGRFAVYPNPANTGIVQLEADLPKATPQADLVVTGMMGQSIRQQTLKVGGTKISERLDLSGLPTGLYVLRLTAGDAVLTQKVILTR